MAMYRAHREAVYWAMEGDALLLDCHSFSEHDNILCKNAHEYKHIDICIGFNEDNTKPKESTIRYVSDFFRKRGYRVEYNKPFSNAVVASQWHESLTIEVNKHCYMNEETLEITDGYFKLHRELQDLYVALLKK